MEFVQITKARELADAYNDEQITLTEFMEELEWCCDRTIYNATMATGGQKLMR